MCVGMVSMGAECSCFMEFEAQEGDNLSGSLLVAHPGMRDPHFCKAVVLVSAHSPEDGTLGVVINRPLGKTLGEESEAFADGPLSDVPLYEGGPVQAEQMLLAAWLWQPEASVFRMYFGITMEKAEELLRLQPEVQLRAFLGYAGWSKGQLERERDEHAWLVAPLSDPGLKDRDGISLWRDYISRLDPDLLILSDLPDDPSLN